MNVNITQYAYGNPIGYYLLPPLKNIGLCSSSCMQRSSVEQVNVSDLDPEEMSGHAVTQLMERTYSATGVADGTIG